MLEVQDFHGPGKPKSLRDAENLEGYTAPLPGVLWVTGRGWRFVLCPLTQQSKVTRLVLGSHRKGGHLQAYVALYKVHGGEKVADPNPQGAWRLDTLHSGPVGRCSEVARHAGGTEARPGASASRAGLGWADRQQAGTEAEGPGPMPQRVCVCCGGRLDR